MKNNHVISCRVDSDELNHIQSVANNLNMKKSAVLKLALTDSLRKYRPIKLTDEEKRSMDKNRCLALDKLGIICTKINRLTSVWLHTGNNINQLAKHANVTGTLPSHQELTNVGLSSKRLYKQNDLLNKGVNKIWQLLELPTQ